MNYIMGTMLLSVAMSSAMAEDIDCEVYHSLYHDSVRIKANYHLIMADGSGVFMLNGSIESDNKIYPLSRDVYFTYRRQGGNGYLFKNKAIQKKPLDNVPEQVFTAHYPAFFSEAEKNITFNFYKEKKGYVISFVSTPLFYCNNS
ncbi:hypothetical protein [Serratia sp. AKBS12]|uniref:hypothetical protein n=1 Tax=Serratia sp. AKBS12 TaxID=2974597 RepID=UPI00216523CF|nr:hypothetical protein [Serratia sp. AKBS12]MCS3407309.1 hypothetical protein [Serratia sp. AKBS12]